MTEAEATRRLRRIQKRPGVGWRQFMTPAISDLEGGQAQLKPAGGMQIKTGPKMGTAFVVRVFFMRTGTQPRIKVEGKLR